MKTILFWIALVALLVQALGCGILRDDLEERFLEQPQEEEDADGTGYAAMNLYSMMGKDTGDSDTPDETGSPSDDFMRELMDQPTPVDDDMAYDQLSIDSGLTTKIHPPAPVKGQLNLNIYYSSQVVHIDSYTLCVPDIPHLQNIVYRTPHQNHFIELASYNVHYCFIFNCTFVGVCNI